MKTCKRCDGNGYVKRRPGGMPDGDDFHEVCSACWGDGEVGEVDFGPKLKLDCPTCAGVGDRTCPTCGDDGA